MPQFYDLVSDGVTMTPASQRWVPIAHLVNGGNVGGMWEAYLTGVPIERPKPLKIVVLRPGVVTDMDVVWCNVPIVDQRAHELVFDLLSEHVQAIPIEFEDTTRLLKNLPNARRTAQPV